MNFTAFCAAIAVVRILPDRSQFFLHDSVTLSCVDGENSSDWTVQRNTTSSKTTDWGKRNGSHCFIDAVYLFDSGQYWCESRTGACSEVINVTVTAGPVILESPGLPVAEGEAVILRCLHKKDFPSSSNFTKFYKNGLLIGNSSTGSITIRDVSKSDEGLYKCNLTGAGESPESWLSVRGCGLDSFRFDPMYVLLPVAAIGLLFVCGLLLCLRRNLKAKVDDDVSYTDVTSTQVTSPVREQPKTNAELILYSTIKPGRC